mmetsp:Transcript_43046/g.111449  ORF Transcript_43046/g.111449 Transcript_43046/m.111449 type:complete len:201 (-) Transcript_43046:149-751(-)
MGSVPVFASLLTGACAGSEPWFPERENLEVFNPVFTVWCSISLHWKNFCSVRRKICAGRTVSQPRPQKDQVLVPFFRCTSVPRQKRFILEEKGTGSSVLVPSACMLPITKITGSLTHMEELEKDGRQGKRRRKRKRLRARILRNGFDPVQQIVLFGCRPRRPESERFPFSKCSPLGLPKNKNKNKCEGWVVDNRISVPVS